MREWGGGIYINKGSPQLHRLIFADNQARFGGGLYVVNDDPQSGAIDLALTNVVFRNNIATGEGGGLATLFSPGIWPPPSGLSLSLTDARFENNTAVRTGGGMINKGGELQLLNVTFTGNSAAAGGSL